MQWVYSTPLLKCSCSSQVQCKLVYASCGLGRCKDIYRCEQETQKRNDFCSYFFCSRPLAFDVGGFFFKCETCSSKLWWTAVDKILFLLCIYLCLWCIDWFLTSPDQNWCVPCTLTDSTLKYSNQLFSDPCLCQDWVTYKQKRKRK